MDDSVAEIRIRTRCFRGTSVGECGHSCRLFVLANTFLLSKLKSLLIFDISPRHLWTISDCWPTGKPLKKTSHRQLKRSTLKEKVELDQLHSRWEKKRSKQSAVWWRAERGHLTSSGGSECVSSQESERSGLAPASVPHMQINMCNISIGKDQPGRVWQGRGRNRSSRQRPSWTCDQTAQMNQSDMFLLHSSCALLLRAPFFFSFSCVNVMLSVIGAEDVSSVGN